MAFALTFYGRGVFLPFVNIGYDISVIGAVLALSGIFLVVDAVRWNQMKYPLRHEEWMNSYFCVKCSRVTIIEAV
ncbi:hypothetical protein [Edaphobacter modestus]|uniref:Uncharacterized protein n=1 Tax=Edaphobacter modestus TaxID=388466 RepID=A0A4Q7Y040_9BACT|nr:hypothetical protein [Edaphobacter modestus]RZU29085.1 hypothetical protein BDD14_6680 [Edaphobacter modestus]